MTMKIIFCVIVVTAFLLGRWYEKQKVANFTHSQALLISEGTYEHEPALEQLLRTQFYYLSINDMVKDDDVRLVDPKQINTELLNYRLPVKGGATAVELLNLYESHYRKSVK